LGLTIILYLYQKDEDENRGNFILLKINMAKVLFITCKEIILVPTEHF